MIARKIPTRSRAGTLLALAVVGVLGVSACDDGDDSEPDTTLVDDLQSDPNVPFDPDVPPGVGNVETDERNNQGFDVDEPGPVGNQTNPND